jgi:hypothetical protein
MIYLNPEVVTSLGRELEIDSYSNYVSLCEQLFSEEVLVGIYSRLEGFKNAPVFKSVKDFKLFDDQVNQGIVFPLGFFAMKQSAIDDILFSH